MVFSTSEKNMPGSILRLPVTGSLRRANSAALVTLRSYSNAVLARTLSVFSSRYEALGVYHWVVM